MKCLSRKQYARFFAAAIIVSCGSAVSFAQSTPLPKFTQLPITFYAPEMANSPGDAFPFMTASRNLRPYDLKKYGYVEDEFIVTGAANVYNWDTDGKLTVITPNAPYGTRILIRHPADPSKFSGAVVVEVPNAARRFDWDMMWGYLADGIYNRGDAW